jgi:hypothetical protein
MCNTCACKYHIEMVELQHDFNNMQTTSKGVHGRLCYCNCDIYWFETPRHYFVEWVQLSEFIDMWTSSLCSMEDFVWHSLCCLKGECLNCGVDMF